MRKISLLLALVLTSPSLARAGFPSIDFKQFPVVKFSDERALINNSTTALRYMDRQIAAALLARRGELWVQDTFLTYRAFVLEKVTSTPTKVSPLVQALYGTSDGFDGYSNPLGDQNAVTGFEVFVSERLKSAPLTARFLAVHEVLGHLSQMVAVYKRYGPRATVEWFDGKTERSIDFIKFTHMTASLMEAQAVASIPLRLWLEDLAGSKLDDKSKTFYANRFRNVYRMGAANYVAARARGENCPKTAPNCISDTEVKIMLDYFRSLGFNFL